MFTSLLLVCINVWGLNNFDCTLLDSPMKVNLVAESRGRINSLYARIFLSEEKWEAVGGPNPESMYPKLKSSVWCSPKSMELYYELLHSVEFESAKTHSMGSHTKCFRLECGRHKMEADPIQHHLLHRTHAKLFSALKAAVLFL